MFLPYNQRGRFNGHTAEYEIDIGETDYNRLEQVSAQDTDELGDWPKL